MDLLEGFDGNPERAWLGTLVAALVAIGAAAVAFPERIYYGFIWRYFWGPVYADAKSAVCAVHDPQTGRTVLDPATGCNPADAYVAEPGYTLVSELGYMIVLVFMLAGVYLLLRRLDLEPYRHFFYALVPWMLFGGALRVVEDAFDATPAGVDPAITYPANVLIISPIIYFTVFVLALGALLVSKWLQRAGHADTYHYPLGGIGLGVLAATVGYLGFLALSTDYVEWHPLILVTVVGLATLIAAAVYLALERWSPATNSGTGLMGAVVVWAHAIDGVANVLASDWTWVFGIAQYGAKHPIDRILSGILTSVQPASVTAVVGDSWLFLVVKIVVATLIVALFDDEFIQHSPRYAVVLLGAVVAVGLGPGTRDMLRVTLGI
jgi:uncharacterized membrane protein